jgi:capsular exopolysaccharide synthesis family protein
MDSLQEAIEKARKEREGNIGQTAAPGDASRPGPAGTSRHDSTSRLTSSTSPAETQAARIDYSATRQVELNPQTLERNRVIAGDIHDSRVEAYRQLRSQILSDMKKHNWQTLAITSAHENAGKTLTAVNLAICMSQEVSQTVMLVDLDLRTPHVHNTLGVDVDKGIVDHLQGEEDLGNIMFNPGFPRLVIVPGVPQGRFSSEILSSPEMQTFLNDITGRYPNRIIIFDLPPLLRNDDALVFVPKADASLLVVEEGVTTPEEIERCLQLMDKSQVLGTILNKAR